MNQELIPELAANTIWRALSDGVVVITPENGDVRVLNDLGAQVWRLVDGERSIAEIEESLLQQYAVTADQLHNDLLQFLEELESRGLLEWKQAV